MSMIQCGSYVGNGSTTGPVITLGWEPQWVLIKRSSSAENWIVYDNARDTANPRTMLLAPNAEQAETSLSAVDFISTGFQLKDSSFRMNGSGNTYIYMAIRAEGT